MVTATFIIRVPATSANIGPGFDVVGLSLSLHLNLTVTIPSSSETPYSPPKLIYAGEGASEVPLDVYKNLITRVALYVLRCHAIRSFPSNMVINVHNEIPLGRGLGSSAAAVIAGVLLGNEVGQLGLSKERMLDFALMVERHPDNVTAALIGGFVGSYLRDLDDVAAEAASVPLSEVLPEYPPDAGENWGLTPPLPPFGIGHFVRFGWSKVIKALAIIPRFELSTAKARQVLPLQYTRKDLVSSKLFTQDLFGFGNNVSVMQVFNLQRIAVLTTALAQSPPDPELIYEAMKDRIHEPYRRTLVEYSFAFLVIPLNNPLDSWFAGSYLHNFSFNSSWTSWHLPIRCRPNYLGPCNGRIRSDRQGRRSHFSKEWGRSRLESIRNLQRLHSGPRTLSLRKRIIGKRSSMFM